MNKTWGILGNPTKEEIQQYMNMPVGKFKEYVTALSKKNKGKSIQTYTIRVHESRSDVYQAFVKVRAFDSKEAVDMVMKMPKNTYNWEKSPQARDKYTYEYIISQVD